LRARPLAGGIRALDPYAIGNRVPIVSPIGRDERNNNDSLITPKQEELVVRTKVLGLVATCLFGASNADAIPLRLDATSTGAFLQTFSIEFADTGDGLFQLSELTSFSAISEIGDPFDEVIHVPAIDGISTRSGDCRNNLAPAVWCFLRGDTMVSTNQSNFTYLISAIADDPVSVAEPGSVALLGLGFAGLLLGRRRRTI
jgi:hypothetical protein